MNRLFTLLLVAAAFSACKKEDKTITPTATNKPVAYLNKTTYFDTTYGMELMQDTISVDAQGNLLFAARLAPGQQFQGFTNIYTKDDFGRITKAEGYEGSSDVIDGHEALVFNFEYDNNGNISKSSCQVVYRSYSVTTYSYDMYNRLVKEDITYTYKPAQNTVREYTYNSPGTLNPTTLKETTGGNPKTTVEYLYTYDNKPNPYTTLPRILYYMGIGQPGSNNILTTAVRDENNTTSYIYRYTADGLPFNRQSNTSTEYKYYYGNR